MLGVVSCPSLLIRTAVIADPEIRLGKTPNCSFKQKAAICLLRLIVLFGKSAVWLPVGRQVFKFTVICSRQTCSETLLFPAFKLHLLISSEGLWVAAHRRVSIEMSECGQVVIISALIFALQVHRHGQTQAAHGSRQGFTGGCRRQLAVSGDQLKT